MTFPHTPRDVTVELFIDAAWFDITGDVYVRDGININRGRTDEASSAQPSSLSLTLNNRLGKYSPRNPMGIFYGKIGRNTRIRVRVDGGDRFNGEVSSWPGRWDTSGNDAYVPIEAAGILRRIGQGTQSATSGLKQLIMSTTPVTYFPLTEGTGSTVGKPATGTYMNTTFHRGYGTGSVSWGQGDLGSWTTPVLRINDLIPAIPGYDLLHADMISSAAAPDGLALEFVYRLNESGVDSTAFLMADWNLDLYVDGTTSGTSDLWRLNFRPDGTNDDIQLVLVLDQGGSSPTTVNLADSVGLAAITDGLLHHVRLQLTKNGTGVDYAVYVDGISVLSGTRATHTLRHTYFVEIFYDRLSNDDWLAFGHLALWENTNIPAVADTSLAALGFAGEAAGRRFERLCGELGVPFYGSGNLDDTLAMGRQYEDQFSGQIAEIEATDRGLIYEPRHTFALGYRTRASMYNLDPQVTLSMEMLQLSAPFEPTEDDTGIRNDVFAQRRDGSSYQATQDTGPLSVLDPPNGVGRYKDEVQVNVKTDDDLPPIAGWLLHLGTVDEARYPRITIDLANPAIADKPALSAALLAVEIGYPIRITDASGVFIYDDINLLVLGYSETIGPYEHSITFNCVPYSPYEVLEIDDADSRVDPGDDSTLSSGVTATASSLSVASSGFLWTTAGGDMPISIMIAGEEMTVTAISGASSPQTFTVTRSVNGVVKTHSTGAVMHLKRPGVVAL